MIIGDGKKHASAILASIKPDKGEMSEDMPEHEDGDMAGLEACAQDMMDAIIKRDSKALAMAMKDMFDMLDSMPHEEGPHTEEDEGDSE